jgi:probable HAF family extracellular repeat protein
MRRCAEVLPLLSQGPEREDLMLRMRRYAISGLAAMLLLANHGMGRVGAEAPLYTVEDLGTFNGLVPTVTGINASGQVSGYAGLGADSRAVRLMGSDGWTVVPGLESVMSAALAINEHGDVAGYAMPAAGLRAFRYTQTTGTLQFIDPLDGGSYTYGTAINASGEVAGYGDASAGVLSFRSAPGSTVAQALPHLGGAVSLACGINDDGQVVGPGYTADFTQHTFRVNPDNSVLDFAGLVDGATSGGCGIDSNGTFVGQSSVADGSLHAYQDPGSATDLDTFGSGWSNAEAIANGVAVGAYLLADGTLHAFVHTAADGSVDLNTRIAADSGWTLTLAHGVNASGQIVGEGQLNGVTHAYRLTPPVPPPPPPPPADTTAPVIQDLGATPSNIWPANGHWVNVTLSVNAVDDSGEAPVCSLTKITADEGTTNDATITGPLSGQVRALRNRDFEERVYNFVVTCADKAGNESQKTVNVTVAKDRKCSQQAIARAALRGKCILAALPRRTPKGGRTPHK